MYLIIQNQVITTTILIVLKHLLKHLKTGNSVVNTIQKKHAHARLYFDCFDHLQDNVTISL